MARRDATLKHVALMHMYIDRQFKNSADRTLSFYPRLIDSEYLSSQNEHPQ